MKTKLTTALAVISLLTGIIATAQDKAITTAQLPAAAQAFIKKNFAKETVSAVWEDREIFDTDYKVRFANGIEAEFDEKGNWEEVDGNHNAIPTSVLPQSVADYISQNYKGQNAVQIDRKSWGFEVELANDTELDFDTSGKFLRVDD